MNLRKGIEYEDLIDESPENRSLSWMIIPQLVKSGVIRPVDVRNIVKLSCKEKEKDILKIIYIVVYGLIDDGVIDYDDLPRCIKSKFFYKAAGFMFDNDDYENAIKAYTMAIERNQNKKNSLFNRALSYVILYKNDPRPDYLDLAEMDLNEVRKMERMKDDVAFLLGFIKEEKGEMDEAINWYQTAIKLNRNNKLAREAIDRLRKSQ
ncbi:MAG: tetratricopeptide repeat protein [Thermocladium sp.]